MKILDLDQSGEAWHKWRSRGIGGSDAAVVMGDVQWSTPEEMIEGKLGLRVTVENERMARGKRLEPVARDLYQALTGVRVRPCCVTHDRHRWLRASLDGLSEDQKLVLEIKCPSDYAHTKALNGYHPDYYKAQLQHNLAVTGCRLLHYWSYTDSPKFPTHKRWALVAVTRDEDYIATLLEREKVQYDLIRQARRALERG